MYVNPNFKTKKAFKEAVAAGKAISLFDPGPFGNVVGNGIVVVEGPHYPKPHTWYAQVTVENSIIVRVK